MLFNTNCVHLIILINKAMPKLKANIRFSNAFDGKVYNEGDEFDAQDNDAAYLITHKICNEVKEEKKSVTTKEDKTKIKTKVKK